MEEELNIKTPEWMNKPAKLDTTGKLLLSGVILSIIVIIWVVGYKMGIKVTNEYWQTVTQGCEMFIGT